MTTATLLRTSLLSVLIALALAHWPSLDPRTQPLTYSGSTATATENHYILDCVDRMRESDAKSTVEENSAAHLECTARRLGSITPELTRYEVNYPQAQINRWQVSCEPGGEPEIVPLPAPLASDFGYAVDLAPSGRIQNIQRTGPRTVFPNARLYEEEQNAFVEFLPRLFVTVAGRSLKPGATWSSTRIQRLDTAPDVVALLQTTLHCQFIRVESARTAHIKVTFSHEFAAADASGQSRGRLRESGGSGEFTFDLQTRQPLTFQAQEHVSFDIVANEGEPTRFERELSIHLRPVDSLSTAGIEEKQPNSTSADAEHQERRARLTTRINCSAEKGLTRKFRAPARSASRTCS